MDWWVRAGISLLLAGCGGCALLTATSPSVEVAQVELRGVSASGQLLGVTLCVTNPNDTELAFRRVRTAIDVAGAPLADSQNEVAVRLPPRSSTPVPFAVTTTVLNLLPQLLDIVRTGAVKYRIHGTVQLDGALAITLPFSHGGRLDLVSLGSTLLTDVAAPAGTKCTLPPGTLAAADLGPAAR